MIGPWETKKGVEINNWRNFPYLFSSWKYRNQTGIKTYWLNLRLTHWHKPSDLSTGTQKSTCGWGLFTRNSLGLMGSGKNWGISRNSVQAPMASTTLHVPLHLWSLTVSSPPQCSEISLLWCHILPQTTSLFCILNWSSNVTFWICQIKYIMTL